MLERIDDLEPDLLLHHLHAADIAERDPEPLGVAGREKRVRPPFERI